MGKTLVESEGIQPGQIVTCFLHRIQLRPVPVDYTPVRFVKKPAGARPGMVVYTTCQTLLADPDEELVKRLAGK